MGIKTLKKIMTVEEFGERDRVVCEVDGESILIFRLDDGYSALANQCSHGNWPLEGGDLKADVVECELHGGQFCIRTGKALRLPAVDDVESYSIKVEDQVIYLESSE